MGVHVGSDVGEGVGAYICACCMYIHIVDTYAFTALKYERQNNKRRHTHQPEVSFHFSPSCSNDWLSGGC